MGKGLFITGTDTGVGKTFVAGVLATLLRARQLTVGVMKPVETGCPRQDGQLRPQDALYLQEKAGSDDPLHEICPYALEMPAAPWVAAAAADIAIDLGRIAAGFHHLSARHQVTLVEGAGGILVPLTETADYADLIQQLNIPVLVVSRAALGTINHTLLTVRWAHHLQLPILGVVVNSPAGPPSPSEQANLQALAKRLPVPLFGSLPFFPGVSTDVSFVETWLDVNRILALLDIT